MLKLKNGASSRVSFDEKSEGVTVGKVTHSTSPNAKVAASTTCIKEYWVSGNKRRMAGDIDFSYYSVPGGNFYTNVTVYTKHQRRVLGVSWWTLNAEFMLLQGSIRIDDGNINGPFTNNFYTTSAQDGWIEISYPSNCYNVPNVGDICYPRYLSVSTFHEVKCNDNVVRDCSVSISI